MTPQLVSLIATGTEILALDAEGGLWRGFLAVDRASRPMLELWPVRSLFHAEEVPADGPPS